MSQNLNDGPRPSESPSDVQQSAPGSASAFFGSSPQRPEFYSAPPSPPPPPAPSANPRWRFLGMGVLAAVGLSLAAWYGFATRDVPAPVPVAATDQNVKFFSVSRADADPKATEQLKAMLSAGAGETSAATPASADLRAVNAPALQSLAKNSPQTAQDIKSGRRVLYRVYLLDFLAQDGDHAELFVDGLSYGDIYLKHAGTAILIPLAPGVPAQIKILATIDGGGGVTIAFISSLGEARTRIMQVGEFEQWQVTVR
jgi:hypothetical protein